MKRNTMGTNTRRPKATLVLMRSVPLTRLCISAARLSAYSSWRAMALHLS